MLNLSSVLQLILGNNFRVRYDPSEVSSDFLNAAATPTSQEAETEATINFSGSAGSYTAVLSVPIHDDNVGERTGQIQVELLPDDAPAQKYRVATNGTQTVMATIWDDDAPELKITGGDRVTEGPSVNARFIISSEVAVTSLTINYTPVSTNFIESGSGAQTTTPTPLMFTGAGPYTAPLDIPVHNDDVEEADGMIMVTLNEEDPAAGTYTVAGSPANSAEVNITDDDSLPLLTISAPTVGTAESADMVNFVITTTTNLGSDFRVRYDPSEVSSDFLNAAATPTSQEAETEQDIDFTGSSGTFTATLSVPIHDDDVGERTGQIQVELLPDDASIPTYRIATNGTQIVMATIYDDDAPELKIAGDGPVTEGTATHASFTITSEVIVSSLTINYTPDEY